MEDRVEQPKEIISSHNPTLEYSHCFWREWCEHPRNYIDHEDRSAFLLQYIQKYCKPDSRILEIGCNVGRNVNYLYNHGFKNIEAIEISERAVQCFAETYPETFKNVKIYNMPVENIIHLFPDNRYDLVFSMAVLQHIHPESEWIFPHIRRVAKKYVLTIEDENGMSNVHTNRNYKKLFEKLYMRQLEEDEEIQVVKNGKLVGLFSETERQHGERYFVRVFEKENFRAVYGAGNGGRMIKTFLEEAGYQFAYFVDDDPAKKFEVKFKDYTEDVPLVIGCSDKEVRKNATGKLITFVHPTAYVCKTALLMGGCLIKPRAMIGHNVTIGQVTMIDSGVNIEHDSHIGNWCYISVGTNIGSSVTVGDGTLIGIGCNVQTGVNIGENCTINSGCTVFNDVPDGTTVKTRV